MTNQVSISTEYKAEPNLRKLARALIALAERQLSEESDISSRRPLTSVPKAVTEPTGDTA